MIVYDERYLYWVTLLIYFHGSRGVTINRLIMATGVTVNAKYTIAQKYGLPVLDNSDFVTWEHEIDLWQVATDLAIGKQGAVIYLSLSGKARQACASLTKEQLSADNGVETLLGKLRELYSKNQNQLMYETYDKFVTFVRESDMSMREFLNEFDRLYEKCKKYNMDLPDVPLAYRLLNSANLPEDKRSMAKGSVTEFTYKNLKDKLRSIYDEMITVPGINEDGIKVEPTDAFYSDYCDPTEVFYGEQFPSRGQYSSCGGNANRGGRRRSFGGRNFNSRGNRGNSGGNRGNSGGPSNNNSNNNNSNTSTENRCDEFGNPKRCGVCGSKFHFARSCPDNQNRGQNNEVHIQLYTNQVMLEHKDVFVGECLNNALIDSGCGETVCGENWLHCFLESLPEGKRDLSISPSVHSFKFGDGKLYPSLGTVQLPTHQTILQTNTTLKGGNCLKTTLIALTNSISATNFFNKAK